MLFGSVCQLNILFSNFWEAQRILAQALITKPDTSTLSALVVMASAMATESNWDL